MTRLAFLKISRYLGPILAIAVLTPLGSRQAGAQPTQQGPAQPGKPPETLDDRFADVARNVPEFGGMFLGPNEQTLRVYLTRVSRDRVNAVQKAVVAVFGAAVVPKGGMVPLQGRYGFLQLKDWYDRMQTPIWSTAGVILTDIDEAKNRLAIGIDRSHREPYVAEQLEKLGIPREAVAIQVMVPVQPASHTLAMPNSMAPWPYLRDGGYVLRRLLCNSGGGLAGGTLGFNVRRSLGPGMDPFQGFVTNSHLTIAWWNLDTNSGFTPTAFYQASGYIPPHFVGVETQDPQGFTTSPCPAGRTCRYSDSAMIEYDSNATPGPGLGRIGRPTGITTNVPNLTVDHGGTPPGEFLIVAKPQTPYLVGLTLNKVGQHTGLTQGTIQMSNVNISTVFGGLIVGCPEGQTDPIPFPNNAMYLSQYVVSHPTNTLVDQDDSGSPVFRFHPVANPKTDKYKVQLFGLLWGRSGTKTFVFSPIGGVPFQQAGVQTDLGAFTYCVPGSNPPC